MSQSEEVTKFLRQAEQIYHDVDLELPELVKGLAVEWHKQKIALAFCLRRLQFCVKNNKSLAELDQAISDYVARQRLKQLQNKKAVPAPSSPSLMEQVSPDQSAGFTINSDAGGGNMALPTELCPKGVISSQKPAPSGSAGDGSPRTSEDETDSALATAKQFLMAQLKDGAVQSTLIQLAAEKAGIAKRTLDRARTDIGVVTRREGFGKGSYVMVELPWYLRSTKMMARTST